MARIILAVGILAAGIAVYGYETYKSQDTAPLETAAEAGNATETAQELQPGEQQTNDPSLRSFIITAEDFKFRPSVIRVKKGQEVRITLKRVNGIHSLHIDEFKVSTRVIKTEEEEDVVQFTANKSGTFEYYCNYGNHRKLEGMVGTLIVEE